MMQLSDQTQSSYSGAAHNAHACILYYGVHKLAVTLDMLRRRMLFQPHIVLGSMTHAVPRLSPRCIYQVPHCPLPSKQP